jgi:hypothetical protein
MAVLSANCAQDDATAAANNLVAPSALSSPEIPLSTFAKGGNGKPGGNPNNKVNDSVSYVMTNDVLGDGAPNWGDSIGFASTTTTDPLANVVCSQNGVMVYTADTTPMIRTVLLSSEAWQGGAADCVAKVYYFSGADMVSLGSVSFHVNE